MEQLNEIRMIKHSMYVKNKCHDGDNNLINHINTSTYKWPKKTLLIASDSIMNDIDEKRLSRNWNVKVRCFSGATVDHMKDYLKPLLKKEPDNIILHVGTNN